MLLVLMSADIVLMELIDEHLMFQSSFHEFPNGMVVVKILILGRKKEALSEVILPCSLIAVRRPWRHILFVPNKNLDHILTLRNMLNKLETHRLFSNLWKGKKTLI